MPIHYFLCQSNEVVLVEEVLVGPFHFKFLNINFRIPTRYSLFKIKITIRTSILAPKKNDMMLQLARTNHRSFSCIVVAKTHIRKQCDILVIPYSSRMMANKIITIRKQMNNYNKIEIC